MKNLEIKIFREKIRSNTTGIGVKNWNITNHISALGIWQTRAAAPQATTVNNGAVSAGKGGSTSSSGSTTVPQPYDSNTLMGQLMNDATQKTYASNARYDDLLSQAPGITGQIHDVLGQAQTRRAIRGMTRRWARMISQAGLSGKARTRWITRGRPTL